MTDTVLASSQIFKERKDMPERSWKLRFRVRYDREGRGLHFSLVPETVRENVNMVLIAPPEQGVRHDH